LEKSKLKPPLFEVLSERFGHPFILYWFQ
jgi:hypothetical protein